MKNLLETKTMAVSLGLLFATLAPAGLYAGPGAAYWNAKSNPTAQPAATHLCSGAVSVPMTVMKPAWPNGRGPMTSVTVGTEQACQVCGSNGQTVKSSWPNGRGPVVATTAANAGERHLCMSGCIKTSRD